MNDSPTSERTADAYTEEAMAIMAKARRRAGISVLILLLGFMAIAGVVVYRLSTMEGGIETRYGLESVAVPAGAEVVSSQLQDGLVTVTYRLEGETAIRVFDGRTGALMREIAVVGE